MNFTSAFADALLAYVLFIPLLTFHEWAHAWTAWKLGDDTAYQRGRVSLNPIVHMEMLGTVILPLIAMVTGALGAGVSIIGWGKPVPVDPRNLKRPRAYDCLIAMAGPAMNLLLAIALIGICKLALIFGQKSVAEIVRFTAYISLVLCFFNLLPVPPLDGSHLWANAVNMSAETYYKIAQAGFFLMMILIQIRSVRNFLGWVIESSMSMLLRVFGLEGME